VSGGTRRGAGAVSGVIYGTSTLGNITGVLVTAFLLVPKFATSELLVAWFVVSIVCVAGSLGLGNVERSLTARGGMS
jgi:hypothetical protein